MVYRIKLKVLLWLGLILWVFLPEKVFAQKFSLSGSISDVITGKPMAGVMVVSKTNQEYKCFSNEQGRYVLLIGYGEHQISVSSAGYKDFTSAIKIYNDEKLDVNLLRVPDIASLRKTLQILQNDSTGVSTGTYCIDNKKLNSLPVLFTEPDLLKNLQFVPGVNKNKSGVVYTSLRGCNTNHTNFFVDGVPIYNIQHASGYISVFNESDFSRTEIIKSGLGANLGGRAGGAILLTPNEGDTKKISGGYQLSLAAFSLNLNGPIGKRLTYHLSYRRSYFDWLLKLDKSDSANNGYHFNDINLRLKYNIDKKNYLYFQIIKNDDVLTFFRKRTNQMGNGKTSELKHNEELKYGGYTTWAKWEMLKKRGYGTLKLAINTIYTLSNIQEEENVIAGSFVTKLTKRTRDYLRGLNCYGLMYDEYIAKSAGNLLYGASFWMENYETGSQKLFQTSDTIKLYDTTYRFEPKVKQYTGSVYASLHKELDKGRKSFTMGTRISFALTEGKLYTVLEPRIAYYQLLQNNWHLKMAYDRTGQMKNYFQTLYSGLMLSDHWFPLTKTLGPQISDQLSIQMVKNINRKWSFEGNAYYIYMEHVSLANPGAKPSNNIDFDWHKLLVDGTGKSYGTEFIFHKNAGLSKGWISWCQTWSYRKIAGYNGGAYYRYSLDRKSDITLAMTHQWRRRLVIGTTIVFTGGFPISVPIAKFILPQGQQSYPTWQGQQILLSGGKNNSTFGLFKRIDFSMNLIGKHPDGRKQQSFTITLYNAFGAFNPELLRYNYDKQTNQYSLVAARSFPLIPSIGYQYRF